MCKIFYTGKASELVLKKKTKTGNKDDDDSQIFESRSSEMPDSGFFFSYMSKVTLTM